MLRIKLARKQGFDQNVGFLIKWQFFLSPFLYDKEKLLLLMIKLFEEGMAFFGM